MNILIITPYCPYPPHKSGGVHTLYSLLKENKEHNIDLFYYNEFDEYAEKEIQKYVKTIYNKNLLKKTGVINRVLSLIKRKPYGLYQYDYTLVEDILSKFKNKQYDKIIFDQFSSISFVDFFESNNKILFEHDCMSLFYYRKYKTDSKSIYEKVYNRLQYSFFYKVEKKSYDKFSKVYFVSKDDALHARKVFSDCNTSIDFINLGVNTEYFNVDKYQYDNTTREKSLVFTGIMSYSPNKDAAIYFCNNIFPEIVKVYPDIKFFIVGKDADKDIKSLENENIVVTGFVDDIAGYIGKSSLYVSPLKYGTGMKNKVLEAMSMSKPIVASEISIEGISELEDGTNIYVAKSDKEWIDKIISLLSDECKRKEFGNSCRKIIINNYSWKKAYSKLFIQ